MIVVNTSLINSIGHDNLIDQIRKSEMDCLSRSLKFAKTATCAEIAARVSAGKNCIDEKYLSIKSVQEIATACLMSEYHFMRCFRQLYNTTPYQYLLTKRLQLAERLLKSGLTDITHVGVYCGFTSISAFSKAFKIKYQTAPSKYLEYNSPV